MKTVSYEIYEGPQTITVIPPGKGSSAIESARKYITLAAEDLPRRSRTYTVQSPEDLPPNITKYLYQAPYAPQQAQRYEAETIDRKYTFRSESPSRGRSEERSIEIVTRKDSPARASSPHPKGILRLPGTENKKDKKTEKSKSSTSTTVATVGAATALTTTTIKSRRLSSSSTESSDTSSSSATSVSESSSSLSRTDFSSYARTSSRTGTFHFAYGPNISPSQLRRHLHHKSSSCRPIALARLQNYTWYINSRGVANLSACPPAEKTPAETDADIVWGLLYNIDRDDESELDELSGWKPTRTGGTNHIALETKGRPWLQGKNNANKMFLMIEAVEWLVDPRHFGLPDEVWNGDKVRAMTYIDEVDVRPGRIRNDYITQMSEAVATGISYGIPKGWIDSVMRMYGIKPRRSRGSTNKSPVDLQIEVEEETHEKEGKKVEEKKEEVKIDEKVTIRRR